MSDREDEFDELIEATGHDFLFFLFSEIVDSLQAPWWKWNRAVPAGCSSEVLVVGGHESEVCGFISNGYCIQSESVVKRLNLKEGTAWVW